MDSAVGGAGPDLAARVIERPADFCDDQRPRDSAGGRYASATSCTAGNSRNFWFSLTVCGGTAACLRSLTTRIHWPEGWNRYTGTSGRGSAWLERLVRDQEAGGSNPLAPTNSFNNLQAVGAKTAHPFAHPHRVAWRIEGTYTAVMAENATTPFGSSQPLQSSTNPLGQPLDFDVRGLGRRVPRTDAPEGWVKKIERREGKVWVGFFPSLDDRREQSTRAHQEGKDARTGFDAKARGTGEVGRVHRRIHR